MKFTDGYWRMQKGIVPSYPIQVVEVETAPDALTVIAATRPVTTRGNMLAQPLLEIRFSAPLPNVIRVQTTHHKAALRKDPAFNLCDLPPFQPQLTITDEQAILMSDRLSVRIPKSGPWKLTYCNDAEVVTESGWRALGVLDTPAGRFLKEELSLDVGECVYGLGERFTAFVKNGQSVNIWNRDGGTSSDHAYKNIPFYLTSRGYGVFVNHPEKVSFEVACEKVERVQFSVAGDYLDYFLIYGPDPKEVVSRYT
ncbi:MAG TPA: alpha-xylosidase, partial [Spirochaetia bacterium]|nr:alpha-xylosidase [Spirochaetia bacterium]